MVSAEHEPIEFGGRAPSGIQDQGTKPPDTESFIAFAQAEELANLS